MPALSESKPSKSSKRGLGKHRSCAELDELREALCSLVHERPGESMVTLAAELGSSASELYWPMKTLKRAGRIRSVGLRHLIHYFPAVNGKAARVRE